MPARASQLTWTSDLRPCLVAACGLLAVALAAIEPPVEPVPPQPDWTVTAGGRQIDLAFGGKSACAKQDITGYYPLTGGLVIERRATVGAAVRRGAPLHVYSTVGQQNAIRQRQFEAVTARLNYQNRDEALQRELQALLDEKESLLRDLAVSKAKLQSLTVVDELQVALLHGQLKQAQQQLARRQAENQQQQDLYQLGQVSRQSVAAAELAWRQAELDAALARGVWTLARQPKSPLLVEQQRLQLAELALEIGDDKSGIDARISALRRKLDGQRQQYRTERERVERSLHEAIRDSFDHTPICWLEIRRGETCLQRINFGPDTASVKSEDGPWTADHGLPFDEQRGFGWQWPDQPPAANWLQQRDDSPRGTVAIVRGQAQWLAVVGPGEVKLKIEIGDTQEWHGARILANDQPVFVGNKLKEEKYQTVEVDLTPVDGRLVLSFGAPQVKGMYAETDGVVADDPWSPKPGNKTWGGGWPMIYVANPDKYYVTARVPLIYAGLLTVAKDGVAPISTTAQTPATTDLRRRLATSQVTVETSYGEAFPGQVAEIGTTPVRLSYAPLSWWEREENNDDQIAREIRVNLPPASASRLRLQAEITVRLHLALPADACWLPIHLVEVRDDRYFCYLMSDVATEVEGFPADDVFVVTDGLQAGAQVLQPPGEDHRSTAPKRFDGVVVPGASTPIITPDRIWARVKDLRPDGDWVQADDWVMTLYSPWLEQQEAENTRRQREAEQRYLQAAEERRVKGIAANLQHRRKVISEQRARIAAETVKTIDNLPIVTAENRHARLQLAQERHAQRQQALAESGARSREIEDAARAAALEGIAADKQYLALIRSERARDWLGYHEAQINWQIAQQSLSFRELDLDLARQQEEVARLESRLQLQQAMKGHSWQENFERNRVIHSPAAGRLFYRLGYNELKRQPDKINKEYEIWSGLPIADVLDMSDLAIEAQLPESLYHRLHLWLEAEVVFPHLGNITLPATVREIGRDFYVPKAMQADDLGSQALSSRKMFKAVFSFQPPAALQDRLIPGVKGQVILR